MLPHQRQALLREWIAARGAVRVSEIAVELGVSEMTVRRDIQELADEGALRKVHGGALAFTGAAEEPGFQTKSAWWTVEKEAIARVAAALIRPGDCVGISGGTTAYAVALQLQGLSPLSIVTNSLPVAQLPQHQGRETVVLGGIRTPSDALVGPVAEAALERLRIDVLVLGVHAFSPEGGLMTPNSLEAETNRRLIASAERVVAVADSSKAGTRAMHRFAGWEDVDTLVTDAGLEAALRAELEQLPVRLEQAGQHQG